MPNQGVSFRTFAFDIEDDLLQARAEIIASHEMMIGQNFSEPCVQEATMRLVAAAYGRIDKIYEAHTEAFKIAAAEAAS